MIWRFPVKKTWRILLSIHYSKTSNIRRTLVRNKIVDHSDGVGASPVGVAPTTSSFSTWHLASRDSAKTAPRQYENLLSVEIWCVLYLRLDGNHFILGKYCQHLVQDNQYLERACHHKPSLPQSKYQLHTPSVRHLNIKLYTNAHVLVSKPNQRLSGGNTSSSHSFRCLFLDLYLIGHTNVPAPWELMNSHSSWFGTNSQ